MLQHRLAHDVADQLLDGARQVIVVDQGEELLEVDVPGNEVVGFQVPRCLPPLRPAPHTTPSPTQLTRRGPPPKLLPIVSTLLLTRFCPRALKTANCN